MGNKFCYGYNNLSDMDKKIFLSKAVDLLTKNQAFYIQLKRGIEDAENKKFNVPNTPVAAVSPDTIFG